MADFQLASISFQQNLRHATQRFQHSKKTQPYTPTLKKSLITIVIIIHLLEKTDFYENVRKLQNIILLRPCKKSSRISYFYDHVRKFQNIILLRPCKKSSRISYFYDHVRKFQNIILLRPCKKVPEYHTSTTM